MLRPDCQAPIRDDVAGGLRTGGGQPGRGPSVVINARQISRTPAAVARSYQCESLQMAFRAQLVHRETMSASAKKIVIVALMFTLPAAVARANSPPKLDIGPTCSAAAPYAVADGRNREACLADEHAAESTLAQTWSKYNAADKTQCIATVHMGGPPSYVELLSCIEVLRDACGADLAWVGAWSAYARPCATARGSTRLRPAQ